MRYYNSPKNGLFLLLVVLCSFNAIGQGHKIILEENPVITRLNQYFIEYNLRKNDFSGWRIQVFVSNDRREMENALASFKSKFPGYFAKWILNDPYYQVRAGMFTDYGEAMLALNDIRKSFRSATLIVDRIRREEILQGR